MAKAKATRKVASVENSNGKFFDIRSLGESLKCTNTETVELNHDLARELLAMPSFVGERPRRKRHIADLIHHMEAGTFHWGLVTLVTCRCGEPHNGKPKGSTFRMNGQHTCLARLELQPSYRAPVRLMRYSAATEADMRRLYATIDRNSPRTKNNVIHSYIVDTEQFGGFSSIVRKYLPAGMSLWKWERPEHRSMHGGEDVAYLLLKGESALVQSVAGFMEQFAAREYKHLHRSPVVAGMLETFSRSVEHAIEFWTAIATGLNFNAEKDPRKKLHKLLLTTSVHGGAGAHKARLKDAYSLPQEAMYRMCIYSWNLWRKGETATNFRIPESRPVALA